MLAPYPRSRCLTASSFASVGWLGHVSLLFAFRRLTTSATRFPLHPSDLSTPDRATVASANRKEFQTPLCTELIQKIRAQGYFPLAQFVKDCLSHPHHGYYRHKRAIIGTNEATDFITAAEVSLFGDVLAAWVMDVWQKMGTPRVLHLIELGPGKGTLMQTVLRQVRFAHPQVLHFMQIHLVELDGGAREREQRTALAEFQSAGGRIRWYASLEALLAVLPGGEATIFIANEYLDALPVAQFRYTERGWVETCVEVNEDAGEEAHFHLVHAPSGSASAFLIPDEVRCRRAGVHGGNGMRTNSHSHQNTNNNKKKNNSSSSNNQAEPDAENTPAKPVAEAHTVRHGSDGHRCSTRSHANHSSRASRVSPTCGALHQAATNHTDGEQAQDVLDCVEVNIVAMQQMELIMKHMVEAQCSACLLIDYGKDEHMSHTLRGIRGHRFVNPLLSPGEVDLSCWVSFRQLRWALERLELARQHLRWFPVCTQREFLQANGIDVRLAQVIKDKDTKSAMKILQNYRRLMDVAEMGETYKVFAFQTRNFGNVSPFFTHAQG